MHDHRAQISLTKFFAGCFGTLGLLLLVVNIYMATDDVAFFGMASIAAGAVLRVRSYFCAMVGRERDAFLLGCETGKVRQMR